MRHGRIYSTDVAASIQQKEEEMLPHYPDVHPAMDTRALSGVTLLPYACICRTWALCTAIQVGKTQTDVGYGSSLKRRWQSDCEPKARSCGFRGQARTRMKGRQIAGEWTPNYARRFCFPRTAIVRYLLEEFNSSFPHKASGLRILHRVPVIKHFRTKWCDTNIITRPFNLFAKLNLNNYCKAILLELMNV